MSILYPVAETAEAALNAARGYAARQRGAETLSAAAVNFVTEPVGPAFATREAALTAYGEEAADWRQLTPVAGGNGALLAPIKPTYLSGRRWPQAAATDVVLWQLSVSYWRIIAAATAAPAPLEAARKVRRGELGRDLRGDTLNALARQPLRAVRAQQPLDIGLFEVSRPEAPDTLIPDE